MKNKKRAIFFLLLSFGLIGGFILPLFQGLPLRRAIEENSPIKCAALGDYENATVISDDDSNWNNGTSENADIVVDESGIIHVVWEDKTDEGSGPDKEIMYSKNSGSGWTNATVISDDASNWNIGASTDASIVVDSSGTVHVVWEDDIYGEISMDEEIMYSKNSGNGWTNATVISDDASNWNTGGSFNPKIAVDRNKTLHVVWRDFTDEGSGPDDDIMYSKNSGSGWTNATVISDDASNWNNGSSEDADIAIDEWDTIHVVWEDDTDEGSGPDDDIMYSKNSGSGWTNATVISDDASNWNNGSSEDAAIAIDSSGTVHVAWNDDTDEGSGGDFDIMYSKNSGSGWTNATVISDVASAWFNGRSDHPSIAIDSSDTVHIVWQDYTKGWWEVDFEIMYSRNSGSGWTNIDVISDDRSNWNYGASLNPDITVDSSEIIHVVWGDTTDEGSGSDRDIMYTKAILREKDGERRDELISGYPVMIFVPIIIGALSAFLIAIRRKTN